MDRYLEEKGIRRTIDLYAHYADTRQAQAQADLFADGAVFKVFAAGNEDRPVQVYTSPAEFLAVFENLEHYKMTFHFNGQLMIDLDESGEKAAAETYTLAYHETEVNGENALMNVAIRYNDSFVKENGIWKFKTRNLYIRFVDTKHGFDANQI
ncbi:nuclear transport factor 2 family protein [Streptococcus macacae]|uniref:SnoaL-like domain-containing protein n=1 Tax=Streptococcus macacae NCTC 11558 TaxID=764298 RepID=G5JYU0_9STRE|nr:nuclear transport factor 2 family protein [Streptococcus macacae]EHJ52323.1 hypothetical protein STRMA_0354 [Streptococcus macacae NCTC 11558]SUN78198.1 putative bile acid 7-alpha-dehydratase [Streptococcus macacae NCTC 11558]